VDHTVCPIFTALLEFFPFDPNLVLLDILEDIVFGLTIVEHFVCALYSQTI
jgi:hypothetical protein